MKAEPLREVLSESQPGAAELAAPRLGVLGGDRKEVRFQHLVDLLHDLGDPEALGLAERGGEVLPEPRQQHLPVLLAGGDPVEVLLEVGGEVVVDVAAEVVGEEGDDQPALVLGVEAVLVLADVVALLDGRDDRGVGRGPADAELLHALDQRRLGVARRRLGEVLLGGHGALLGRLAVHDQRQPGVLVAVAVELDVVAALEIDLEEAVEGHDLAGGAQGHGAVGAGDIDRGALEARGFHLAGDRALPDQVVEPALVGLEPGELVRRLGHVGRADALVGFLGVLGLVLVHARRGRHVGVAVAGADHVAGGHHRLGRHVDAVGAHVGDVAGLVEPLGRRHGLARAHAELAARLLLQGRGHERGGGVAAGGLGLDGGNGQRRGPRSRRPRPPPRRRWRGRTCRASRRSGRPGGPRSCRRAGWRAAP